MSGEQPPTEQPQYENTQRHPRISIHTEVRLDFPDLKDFVQAFSSNLSLGGMFLQTSAVQPVGTTFEFSCRLADDYPVVEGLARVVWVREQDAGPDQPAGMGCEFEKLYGDSRQLIFHIVDRHIQKGGEPFDLQRAKET